MKRLLLLTSLVVGCCTAQAVQRPPSCGGDVRIKCAKYDPKEVIAITAMFGYQTFVYFAPGEEIMDMGGGDTTGWTIGVIEEKNGIFIKPKGFKPVTNITVVTKSQYGQRIYNFDFDVEKLTQAEKRTYMVWFQYPEVEEKGKKTVDKSDATSIATTLKYASAKKPKNEDYWFDGSSELVPTAAWDDGEFTYFRFAPNVPFPAVYGVNEDGKERLLNKHYPERNTIAVQSVGRKFVLRRGDVFTCIFNESYDRYGVENQSNTVSPSVVREMREGARKDEETQRRVRVPAAAPAAPAVPQQSPRPNAAPAGAALPTVDLSAFVPDSAQQAPGGAK